MGFSRQEYWSGVPLPSPEEEIVVKKLKVDGKIKTGSKIIRVKDSQ